MSSTILECLLGEINMRMALTQIALTPTLRPKSTVLTTMKMIPASVRIW